jgi:hypothetical protein
MFRKQTPSDWEGHRLPSELENSEAMSKIACRHYHTVPVEKVSAQSLSKTGVFRVWAGDFREILIEVADFRRLETNPKCANPRAK